GLAPAGRTAADGARDDAAERVAVLARRLDGRDHALCGRQLGTADRRGVHLLARDLLDIAVDGQRADLRDPCDHGDVPPHRDPRAPRVRSPRPGGGWRAWAPAAPRRAVSRALVRPPPRQSRKPYFAS